MNGSKDRKIEVIYIRKFTAAIQKKGGKILNKLKVVEKKSQKQAKSYKSQDEK